MKKNAYLRPIIIVAAIVIFLVAIAISYLYFNNHNKPQIVQQNDYQYSVPGNWKQIKSDEDFMYYEWKINKSVSAFASTIDRHYPTSPEFALSNAQKNAMDDNMGDIVDKKIIETANLPIVYLKIQNNTHKCTYYLYNVISPTNELRFMIIVAQNYKQTNDVLENVNAILQSVEYQGAQPDYSNKTMDNDNVSLKVPDNYYVTGNTIFPVLVSDEKSAECMQIISPQISSSAKEMAEEKSKISSATSQVEEEVLFGKYNAYYFTKKDDFGYIWKQYYFDLNDKVICICLISHSDYTEETFKNQLELLETAEFR